MSFFRCSSCYRMISFSLLPGNVARGVAGSQISDPAPFCSDYLPYRIILKKFLPMLCHWLCAGLLIPKIPNRSLARFLKFISRFSCFTYKTRDYVTLDSYIPDHSDYRCGIWIYRHCGGSSNNCEDHLLHIYCFVPVEFDRRKKQSIVPGNSVTTPADRITKNHSATAGWFFYFLG